MSSILDRVDVDTGCISPERRLFVGVITAAVLDATGGTTGGLRGGDHRGKAVQSAALARAWFADGGEDFQTVCALAGYESKSVRDNVLAYLSRVDADPSQVIRLSGSRVWETRPTTMSDVAAHAGVSMVTVVRVLDGKPNVPADAAARVLASVEALGYVPSRRRNASVH